MKINTASRHSKRKTIAILTIATLLLMGAVSYALINRNQVSKNNTRDESGINYAEPTDEEKASGDKAKQDAINASKDNTSTGSDPAPAPLQQSDGSKSVVGMNITAAYKSGENYRIQTLIQTVTSSGTCVITITDKNGSTHTETVGVQALPSSSTCKGFTLPINKLATGLWKIDIKFENDTLRGATAKDVLIS